MPQILACRSGRSSLLRPPCRAAPTSSALPSGPLLPHPPCQPGSFCLFRSASRALIRPVSRTAPLFSVLQAGPLIPPPPSDPPSSALLTRPHPSPPGWLGRSSLLCRAAPPCRPGLSSFLQQPGHSSFLRSLLRPAGKAAPPSECSTMPASLFCSTLLVGPPLRSPQPCRPGRCCFAARRSPLRVRGPGRRASLRSHGPDRAAGLIYYAIGYSALSESGRITHAHRRAVGPIVSSTRGGAVAVRDL